jgi:hypothetical protein
MVERVYKLISSDDLSWSNQVLSDNLLPADEEAVLKIPLGAPWEDA